MLSARRSRHRIPIALVASCLMGATLPGVVCPVVCLTHETMTLHGPHGGQMTAMPPCHTGDGVKAAQPPGDLTLVALPAGGRLVLGGDVRSTAVAEPPVMLHSAFLETRTPPPRLG
jgi:hypothetical protein